jgi:hypothetical protein
VSNTLSNGLTTSYAYDQMGEVVTEPDPPVGDRVTGDPHTAQITTSYADGNVLSQTAADTTSCQREPTIFPCVPRTFIVITGSRPGLLMVGRCAGAAGPE